MNRPIASSTSLASWVGLIRCATGATWVSTNAAASTLREWPMVSWATCRAFHAASSPETTRAQSFGSR